MGCTFCSPTAMTHTLCWRAPLSIVEVGLDLPIQLGRINSFVLFGGGVILAVMIHRFRFL